MISPIYQPHNELVAGSVLLIIQLPSCNSLGTEHFKVLAHTVAFILKLRKILIVQVGRNNVTKLKLSSFNRLVRGVVQAF